jgi:hypothetical protein
LTIDNLVDVPKCNGDDWHLIITMSTKAQERVSGINNTMWECIGIAIKSYSAISVGCG